MFVQMVDISNTSSDWHQLANLQIGLNFMFNFVVFSTVLYDEKNIFCTIVTSQGKAAK